MLPAILIRIMSKAAVTIIDSVELPVVDCEQR